MAKAYLLGWYSGVKKETGKAYKLLVLGDKSDAWHGFSVETKYCPPELQVPDCKPGSLVHLEYDRNGFIDKDCPITVLNG